MNAEPVEIYVLDKTVRLLQPAEGFRTSLDSVLLAAACPGQGGDRVLDLGCGVGGAAFCLLRRVPDCYVDGIDIQADYIDLANKNIPLNNASNRIGFKVADVRALREPEIRYDHVICNPPFLDAGTYTPSPSGGKATALGHLDEDIGLTDWIDAAFRALKSGGSLTVIHRADFCDKIIQGLGRRFGAVEIVPLWPRAGQAAKRVIIRALKDRRSPAMLHPGIVLHEADGSYTENAERLLRAGDFLK